MRSAREALVGIGLGLALACASATAADAATISFDPPTTAIAGNVPRAVAAGDLNGDGKLDLAAARGDSQGGVLVALGNGDGTFAFPTQYFTQGSSVSVAIGDLDADGRPDLVVANLAGGIVSVLRGLGGGAFAPAVNYTAGLSPQVVALSDLNSDGRLDLVVADNFNGAALVRLGDGAGGFGAQSSYPAGVQPRGMAVGDVDSDGNPDAVLANFGSNNVSVLRGVGDGTFLPAVNHPVPSAPPAPVSGPQAVAIADLDGGGADLAVAAINIDRLAFLRGTGGGAFAPAAFFGVGHFPSDVAIADFDRDAIPDVATADSGSGNLSVSVLRGRGDGTFDPFQTFAAGSNPAKLTTGDFNGDGRPDIAVAKVAGNGVSVLLNTTVIDTTAPHTTIDSGPSGVTNDPRPAFTFHADEPATFECAVTQSGAPSFSACASGDTFGPLADGVWTFRVRATDAAGNVEAPAVPRMFVVDTIAPHTTIDSGPSGLTNDATPEFTFHASDGAATFECAVSQAGAPSFSACASGDKFGPLADGVWTFRVRATDAAGNVEAPAVPRSFVVDTIAPHTTIDSGPSGLTNDPRPAFTFHPSDGAATFECAVSQAGAPSFSACASGDTFGPLADGAWTFRVRATDTAGNVEAPAVARTFTVDTVAPQTTITAAPASPGNDATPTFAFSSSESGSTFGCRVDAQPFAPCTSPHTTASLGNGRHTFEVRATDAAGNVDATPASRAFTVCTGPASGVALLLDGLLRPLNPALADQVLAAICR